NPTISSPANQAVLPLAPVNLTGTATDNTAVGNVELSIQDLNSGLWWNPANSSWGTTNARPIIAAWSSTTAPATSVNWRYTFTGVSSGGEYLVWAKTRDANGNVSGIVQRTFGMPGTTPPPPPPLPPMDTTRPNGTATYPLNNAQLPLAAVRFTGQATDNVGVTMVRVALRDMTTGRYWSGSGSSGFSTAYRQWDTVLDAPGATQTPWYWDWTPRAAGTYRLFVQAIDAAGNKDNSQGIVNFTVTGTAPELNPPETVLSNPANGATLPSGSVTLSGSASDDIGVAGVRVSIQDAALQYWTGSAWSPNPATVNATLGSPGGTSTTWSYAFTAPEGSYVLTATAVDTSNNLDASPATGSFSASGAPDTQAPTTSITTPAQNQQASSPVSFTGVVVDNVGATQVRVAIRNNALPAGSNWWNGSGWGGFGYVLATSDQPGPNGVWSYTFNAPATGSYGTYVRAIDGAGNLGAWSPWRSFSVV
ncbi:MAG TPA: Ig-like domain-containing protein, partial [Actinomycetota bacterium]